jgi:integrase
MPETYFCIVADEWQPKIIDDPALPQKLVTAFPARRDQLITRILFESGARISEVLSLQQGDWRRLVGQRHGALATNKGAWGERVKEIWWSSETSQQLQLYLNGERCQHEAAHRRLADLPEAAPLFITEQGQPYRYPAFYYHWRKACAQAGLNLHPHQARHWFVTMALRRIQALPDEEQQEAYRQGLITYMHWKNPETLKAYDHHLRLTDFSAVHAAIGDLLQAGATDRPVPISPEGFAESTAVSPEAWARLSQFLDYEKEHV